MSENTIGKIPEFTQDDTTQPIPDVVQTEVKPEEPEVPEEKETPAPPAEKPIHEPETVKKEEYQEPVDAKVIKGLLDERVKLLKEVSELKGQKRQLKQDQLIKVQKEIDELKDIHPQDVDSIERVLRAKGYVSREEMQKTLYESVKDEELTKFLERYPEYKPENDPGDANWTALQRELGYYRTPENPRQISDVLERAHRSIIKVPADFGLQTKKRQVEVASVGKGGAQQSTQTTKFDPYKRAMLARGGFSEEDIQKMENRL